MGEREKNSKKRKREVGENLRNEIVEIKLLYICIIESEEGTRGRGGILRNSIIYFTYNVSSLEVS